MRISFALLNENAVAPKQDGFVIQLFASKGMLVQPSEIMKVNTGLSVEMEKGFTLNLVASPELQDKGMAVFPGPLVLYSSHDAELFVPMQNQGRQQVNILPGDLIVHGIVTRLEDVQLAQVDPKPVAVPKKSPKKIKPERNPNIKFEIK